MFVPFLLTPAQMRRIGPHFPLSHGVPRVDDSRLKDWRRIATRYDRCATTFFGAITLATIVIFWIGE